MKESRIPKLTKKGKSRLTKAVERSSPLTVQELLEQGSAEEEKGDRWLGSDLSKALRFYQIAYSCYSKVIADSPEPNIDAFYNATRLLFHVYNHYLESNGVYVESLTSVETVLTGDSSSVFQDLDHIYMAHEKAISILHEQNIQVPIDLLYNYALVITEVIELQNSSKIASFDEIMTLGKKTALIFQDIIEQQIKELDLFLEDLKDLSVDKSDKEISADVNNENTPVQEEFTSESVTQPSDIFDSILSSFKLLQAILETFESSDEQLVIFKNEFSSFIHYIDNIATSLLESYQESSNPMSDFISSVTSDQLLEYKLLKVCIDSLATNNLEAMDRIWDSAELPEAAAVYMSRADCKQTYKERNNLSAQIDGMSTDDSATMWQLLTSTGICYKKAQDLLSSELQTLKKTPTGEDIGNLIAQISSLMIVRADLDLERSTLKNHHAAAKNRDVLIQNAKTLLKNALKTAGQAGGLREKINEKLLRERRKLESATRLCVLDNKSSPDEMDRIIGKSFWRSELASLNGQPGYTLQ